MKLHSVLLVTVLLCVGCETVSDSYYRNPLFVRLQIQPDEGADPEPPAGFWSAALVDMTQDPKSRALLRRLTGVDALIEVQAEDDQTLPTDSLAPLTFWIRDGGVEVGKLEGRSYALHRAVELHARSNGVRIKPAGSAEEPFAGYDAWELPVLLALEDYVMRKLTGWHGVGTGFATRAEHAADLESRCVDYLARQRWE